MIYNQSGLICSVKSNYESEASRTVKTESVETPITSEPEAPAGTQTKTRTELEVKANAFDTVFFFAREYWWAVALAAFLLGRYLNRKGA